MPRRQEASEQLVRLLTCSKELQERAKAAYLKATGAVKPVESPAIRCRRDGEDSRNDPQGGHFRTSHTNYK